MKKFSRRLFAALLSVVLMFSTLMSLNVGTAFAATSGSCGTNATWSYNATTKTLTISGTGATKDYRDTTNKLLRTEQAPWIEYKSEIKNVVVNEGITEIGDYAFFECTALTSVSLPSTLTKLDGIGIAAGNVDKTYGCFQSCTALETITLPDSLTEIEPYVFNGCTALTKIVIPNNVTTIGKYAFFECSSLERVTFGNSLTTLGENSFRNSGLKKINWNENLTAIPNYAFFGSGLVEVTLPETIASVGTRAFADCSFLRTITVNGTDTAFNGDVCNGSNQTVTIYGHSGSTAQSFAEQYSYEFISLDACSHANTHSEITKEANCTETGVESIICDDCGETVREITIDALGHEWGEPVESVDSTEEDGHIYNSYVCSVCGETKEEAVHQRSDSIDPENITIDPSLLDGTVYIWIPGTYTTTVVRAANCTQTGLERYHCTICEQTETHITRAHHTVTDWTVTEPATCTEEGTRTGKCTECGETVTETVKPTGHDYDKENPDEVYDDEEDGHTHKIYICKNCGEEIVEYVHNEWVDGLYTPTSTTYDNCELPGVELDTCTVCGERRTVTIPARGEHDLYETSRTEPDCTTRGRINLACHNCTYTTVQYISALGHDYVRDDSKSTDATCTEDGSIFYKCSRCSSSKTESVAALGHIAAEGTWVVDTEPSCTKTGTGHGTCDRCGEEFTDSIEALGHDYQAVETDLTSEGKPGHVLSVPTCTRCNARETGEIVHKEWTEGNYTVTATTPATCTVGSQEIRQCTICNSRGTVEVEPALGHMWTYAGTIAGVPFTGEVTADGVTLRCPHCMRTKVVPMTDIAALWNFDVIGEEPSRTGAPVIDEEGNATDEERNKTSYLDLNGDGIINGRDWAYIKTLTARQNELIAEREAEQEEPPAEDNNA
jgi:hypothetical protein